MVVNLHGAGMFCKLVQPTLAQYGCAISGKGLGGSSAVNNMLWNKPSQDHIEGGAKISESFGIRIRSNLYHSLWPTRKRWMELGII